MNNICPTPFFTIGIEIFFWDEAITNKAVVGAKSSTVWGVVLITTDVLGSNTKEESFVAGREISVVFLSIDTETEGTTKSTVDITATLSL